MLYPCFKNFIKSTIENYQSLLIIRTNLDHFNYLSSYEGNDWNFLWNNDGKDAFPYIRYRINSTPTYYLFDEKGNLVEKIKGFKKGYSDDTQSKIEELLVN